METAKRLREEQIKRYYEREINLPATSSSKKFESMVCIKVECLLKDAAKLNDHEEISELLTLQTDDIKQVDKNEALFIACSCGSLQSAQLLLIFGADVDHQDEDLWTPLHISAARGHCSVVQLLFEFNADTTLLDVDGNFAIDHAVDDNVRSLIANEMAECGVYAEDLPSIRTRFFKAMSAAVRSAISRGKDLTQPNKNGVTPLHTASAYGYYEMVELLIESGGVPADITDSFGHTPLDIAKKYKQTRVVQYLLNKGGRNEVSPYITADEVGRVVDHSSPQPTSTPWKLKNITKEDSICEGLWLKQHSCFGAVGDNQPSILPSNQPSIQPSNQPSILPSNQPSILPSNQPSIQPSNQRSIEMIYDTCPDIIKSKGQNTKIQVEELYDSTVNVLKSLPIQTNHDNESNGFSTYEDIASITDIKNHQAIVAASCDPQPYEEFVPKVAAHLEAVDSAKPSPPKLPPRKILNKSASVNQGTSQQNNDVPEAWLTRMIPKPRPIPVAISRRDSTPTNTPPPRPPRQKTVSASSILQSNVSSDATPPPLPPRSPKLSNNEPLAPPSYDAILRSPEQYPTISTSLRKSVPAASAKKNLKKSPSTPVVSQHTQIFPDNSYRGNSIIREESSTNASPRPYRLNNMFY